MFAITLTEKGGDQRRLDFDKAEITIGRVQGNDVVLPKGNVSKRHARIVLKDGKFIIVDARRGDVLDRGDGESYESVRSRRPVATPRGGLLLWDFRSFSLFMRCCCNSRFFGDK